MSVRTKPNRSLGPSLAASCLALAACGGESNLGEDTWIPPADERWGAENAESSEAETLYRGSRVVLDFEVQDGSLFALLRTAEEVSNGRMGVELVQCSADACESDLRTLWRGSEVSNPAYEQLLVRPPDVFWVNLSYNAVVRCASDGCQGGPRVVGPIHWRSEIEVDDDYAYWVHGDDLLIRCPHKTGCASAASNDYPTAPLVNAGLNQVRRFGDSLYVGYDGGRRLVRIDASGNEETLYETTVPLSTLAIDAGGVYFATNVLTGSVLRCPLTGECGAGEVLAERQRWPQTVLSDTGTVVWANTIGDDVSVMKLAEGSTPSQVTTSAGDSRSVEMSDGYVYWASYLGDVTEIRRVER